MNTITSQMLAEEDAPCFAHMSDDQIQYWIDRLTAEREAPLYHLQVSSHVSEKSGDDLFRYKREAARRASISYAIAAE